MTQSKSSNSYQRAIIAGNIRDDATKGASSWPAVSTNIYVKMGDKVIGLIQSLSVSMDRDVTPMHEIGSEHAITLMPQKGEGGTIECEKMAIMGKNFLELIQGSAVAGRPYLAGKTPVTATRESIAEKGVSTNYIRNIYQQRIPFDIEVVECYSEDTTEIQSPGFKKTLTTKYQYCWVTSFSQEYTADTVQIIERVSLRFLICTVVTGDYSDS